MIDYSLCLIGNFLQITYEALMLTMAQKVTCATI